MAWRSNPSWHQLPTNINKDPLSSNWARITLRQLAWTIGICARVCLRDSFYEL